MQVQLNQTKDHGEQTKYFSIGVALVVFLAVLLFVVAGQGTWWLENCENGLPFRTFLNHLQCSD